MNIITSTNDLYRTGMLKNSLISNNSLPNLALDCSTIDGGISVSASKSSLAEKNSEEFRGFLKSCFSQY
jgi:hypothetical protein